MMELYCEQGLLFRVNISQATAVVKAPEHKYLKFLNDYSAASLVGSGSSVLGISREKLFS